jgi:hypothetical protein
MLHHQPKVLEIRPDPDWPDWLKSEFKANQDNARVGTQLLSVFERAPRVASLDQAGRAPASAPPRARLFLDRAYTRQGPLALP